MTHEFSETAGPAAPPTKMSLWTKLAYGAGDMGAGMTSNLIAFSFLIFLTEVAGIRPAAAGTVLLISKVWDAVNDPLVGVLSDRTQTRWGRRYPWILLSALPFGFTFFSHVVGAGGRFRLSVLVLRGHLSAVPDLLYDRQLALCHPNRRTHPGLRRAY